MDIREWPLKKIQPQIKMTSMIRAYDDAQPKSQYHNDAKFMEIYHSDCKMHINVLSIGVFYAVIIPVITPDPKEPQNIVTRY